MIQYDIRLPFTWHPGEIGKVTLSLCNQFQAAFTFNVKLTKLDKYFQAQIPCSFHIQNSTNMFRNHRQERFQWGVAVPQGKVGVACTLKHTFHRNPIRLNLKTLQLRALPAHRLSSSNESSSSSSSNSNRNSSSRRRTMLRKGRRRGSSRRPRRGRGVLRFNL